MSKGLRLTNTSKEGRKRERKREGRKRGSKEREREEEREGGHLVRMMKQSLATAESIPYTYP